MAHIDVLTTLLEDKDHARDVMNLTGLMANFESMLPTFFKELKVLLAPEGGKWEWLRHSFFHIPTYVRDLNVPTLISLSPQIQISCDYKCTRMFLPSSSLTTQLIATFKHSTGMLL